MIFASLTGLVGGLASEKIRWSDSVMRFREQAKMLPGDVLLVRRRYVLLPTSKLWVLRQRHESQRAEYKVAEFGETSTCRNVTLSIL
jgi:hypothetical protein